MSNPDATTEDKTEESIPIEKKPGWQIILEATKDILEGQCDHPGCIEERFHPLRIQCLARTNEIIPPEHLDEVINAVIQVSFKRPLWYDEVQGFILDQAGEERIDRFLEKNPDWTKLYDPDHPDDRNFGVCTKEIEAKYLADRDNPRPRHGMIIEISNSAGLMREILSGLGRQFGSDAADIPPPTGPMGPVGSDS